MSPKHYLLVIMHIIPFLLHTLAQRATIPTIPCPDIFQYSYDENLGGTVGLITIQKDGSSTSELQVNMSMNTPVSVTTNIKLVVLSKQDEIFYGNSIRYAVKFPLQEILPKLTLLRFNGKILCQASPDPLEPGVIQTSMWAKSIITTFSGHAPGQPAAPPPIQPTSTEKNPYQFSLTFDGVPQSSINSESLPFDVTNLQNNPFLVTAKNQVPDVTTPTATPPRINTPVFSVRSSTVQPLITSSVKSISGQCGKTRSSQNLIIGGEGIAPGEFPWLVAILHKEEIEYKLHCTGNLISDRHVLTAGSCVRYHNAPLFDKEDLAIVLGKLSMEDWTTGGTIRGAKIIQHHPNYKQDSADYDIAVILLNATVQFIPTTRPICLWDQDESLDDIVGSFGTVAGWHKEGKGDLALVANKVEMPIVSEETCLRSNKAFMKFTSSRTFCAGLRDNAKGPCSGDSGAGFMIRDDTTKTWYLRGFVGYSLKDPQTLTCDLNHYVIFIDVAKMRLWIEEVMHKIR